MDFQEIMQHELSTRLCTGWCCGACAFNIAALLVGSVQVLVYDFLKVHCEDCHLGLKAANSLLFEHGIAAASKKPAAKLKSLEEVGKVSNHGTYVHLMSLNFYVLTTARCV